MLMNWHIVTSAAYHAGTPVASHMYFLSDTREIYRGSEPFTESVILCTEFPTTGIAINRLYVNSATLEGKIYDGSSWTTVIKPIDSTVTVDGTNPVSGKAVAAYVAAEMAKVSTSANTVSSLTWDSAEHLLTVTKGDNSKQNITFDGLGVDLQYTAADGNLQLVDAKGNTIGSPIKLDLERFVTSGEYNAENKEIVLYFDAEKTESVTIPVAALVDTYTAEGDGKSLLLSVENNVVKGSIKISTADGNMITADENGLYVVPIDISGKMDKAVGAVEGDIAIFDADGNAIDSGKTFEDIVPNNSVYEGSTLEEAITGKTPVKGDIVIVSTPIGETGKVQKTVYQFNGETWTAFDSDYDASKIILPEDWLTTTKIGVIQTLTNGQATIATAGTDILTALKKMTLKETQPSVTDPSVSFGNTASEFKAYEVGTKVTPEVTATLSAGTYQYGRIDSDGNYDSATSAGISAKSWTIKDNNSTPVEKNSNSAKFDEIVVGDDTSYKLTATATYDESAYSPATNLKNLSSKSKIAGGSKSATTAAITGYRNCFYGTLTTKHDLTTAEGKAALATAIRGLTATGAAVSAGAALNLSIPVGCLRAIVAYPADATSLNTLSSVKDANASDAQINTAFNLIQIDVEGANGYTAKAYKVFYKDFADPVAAANTYKVTL